MPPADRPVVAALLQPAHYLVTPVPVEPVAWLDQLDAALAGGFRRIQLRAPGFDPSRWAVLAEKAVQRCHQAGADVLVNGDAALAERLGAGLHLRSAQLEALAVEAHALSGGSTSRPGALPQARGHGLLAASCHSIDDLLCAQALGCDFAVVGPVQATATHPGVAGIGWDGFATLRESVSLPLYAIGGLAVDDLAAARAHGAQGIAAIRGLWPS
jgi:8-oxo-dGTP diphosphatase